MKKYFKHILIISSAFVISNCSSPEPKQFEFESITRNLSNEDVVISLYNDGLLIKEDALAPDESTSCFYTAEFFEGLRGCLNSSTKGIDSITIIFSNGKGFICLDKPISEQTLCFGDEQRDLFFESDAFNNLGNRQYEFIITEDDFNNAHELPE